MIKITLPDGHYYDEMLTAQGEQRPHYNAWWQWFRNTDQFSIRQKKAQAELLFHRIGITFNVYGEDEGTERLIPFDSVPRIIPAGEWQRIDRGIRQRVKALNAFLYDIYHEQNILRAGLIPAEQVLANEQYQPCMQGINLPNNTYAHITGVDMVRNNDGQYYVLEDNLRWCGKDRAWLERTATANTVLPQEILLLIGNETEDYFLLKKEGRQPGGKR